eukprot:1437444-Amphidinium_carterae.1
MQAVKLTCADTHGVMTTKPNLRKWSTAEDPPSTGARPFEDCHWRVQTRQSKRHPCITIHSSVKANIEVQDWVCGQSFLVYGIMLIPAEYWQCPACSQMIATLPDSKRLLKPAFPP